MPTNQFHLWRSRDGSASTVSNQPTDAQITRIDALTAAGRTNWFALLAYLTFALVTTLGVKDIDFFSEIRQTQLPLVGVSIPTFSFFVFAPILGAALYAYLHLHVRKVTEALAEPLAGDPPLETRIRPWLLNDFVLRQRRDGAIARRPLDALAWCVTLGLIWLAGPVVLAIMWMRTWPAHALWLSALSGVCLMAAVYAGAVSWSKMRADVGRRRSPYVIATSLGVMLLCLPVAWLTTANSTGIGELVIVLPEDDDTPRSRLEKIEEWSRAIEERANATLLERIGLWSWTTATGLAKLDGPDLTAARLSVLPPEHADADAARHRYRTDWCKRNGLDADTCGGGNVTSADAIAALLQMRDAWCKIRSFAVPSGCRKHFAGLNQEFDREWPAYRRAIIAGLQKPVLGGRDIRRADASNAHLVGVDFRGAQMEGADLSYAEMEGADLIEAQMEGANLSGAQMVGAVLSNAQMVGAVLSHSSLMGKLRSAMVLKSTNISAVINDGGALRFVDFRPAELGPLSKFRHGFRNAFGDATVLLPIPGADRPCQWSRKELPDEEFYARWRGWLSLAPEGPFWQFVAPEEWWEVPLVLPHDPACTWHE